MYDKIHYKLKKKVTKKIKKNKTYPDFQLDMMS